jgi:hypothetical protein
MVDAGYAPDQISRFTLADIDLIFGFWGRNPPIRAMVAAYLGIKPQAKAPPTNQPSDSVAAMRARFPDGLLR